MENKKACVLAKELDLTNDISKLANETRKNYYKDWRKNNKDKIKKYNSNYWQKRAEKLRQNSKQERSN